VKIVVCIKQVIDTGAEIRVKDGRVDDAGSPRVMNPYDEFAVTEALKVRDQFPDSTVTVVSLGPDGFKDTLRSALAMGADRAVHLLDPAFENIDSLGVSYVLAKALRLLKFNLILCGRQAVDDDMSQVGPSLAAFLNVPCVCVVTKLDIEGDEDDGFEARITRQIPGGSEIIDGKLPLLITCQKGLNQPKLPSLKGIIAAKKKEIEVMDAASVNFDPIAMGAEANRVKEVEFALPPKKDKGVLLEGSSEEAVEQLVQILRDDLKIV
jgi:electron transfer flavoprotein beta subunit